MTVNVLSGVFAPTAQEDARYGNLAFPAGLTKAGAYSPDLHAYNLTPSNTAKTRASLASALAGTGGFHLLCVGDSITAGSTSAGQGSVQPATQSYPVQLRNLIAALGFPLAGTGAVFANSGLTVTRDSRLTVSGAWSVSSSGYLQSPSGAATITFVSDKPGVNVMISYNDTATGFTYTIDGGAPVTVSPGSTFNELKIVVSGLANTTHTVVTTTAAAGAQLVAFDVYNASGVKVSNAGMSGTTAVQWSTTSPTPISHPLPEAIGGVTPNPHAVVVQLGVNDALQNLGPSAFATALATVVTYIQANAGNPDVYLSVPPAPNPTFSYLSNPVVTDVIWASYVQKILDVATTAGLAVLNPCEVINSWAIANANSVMGPDVHPTPAGYTLIAQVLLGALRPI